MKGNALPVPLQWAIYNTTPKGREESEQNPGSLEFGVLCRRVRKEGEAASPVEELNGLMAVLYIDLGIYPPTVPQSREYASALFSKSGAVTLRLSALIGARLPHLPAEPGSSLQWARRYAGASDPTQWFTGDAQTEKTRWSNRYQFHMPAHRFTTQEIEARLTRALDMNPTCRQCGTALDTTQRTLVCRMC